MAVEFDIGVCGFSVRRATSADGKAVRMLLPELRDAAQTYVAIDGHYQLVVGAVAAAHAFRQQPLPGPGIALHVIGPCRRHGVATELLCQLEQDARNAGAKGLYAAKRAELGSDEFRGWQWLGFAPCETVEEHLLPVAPIESRLGPIVDRMRSQGRIPANARVIPLYDADKEGILHLHLRYMGGDRKELQQKLRGQCNGAFLPRQSRVLLIDNKVVGCLLASRPTKETIVVDANIVEANLRGGWANAWLKLEALRGAPDGVVEFRFTSFDHYTDTRSFASRMGGTTLRTTTLMMRPIGAAEENPDTNNRSAHA